MSNGHKGNGGRPPDVGKLPADLTGVVAAAVVDHYAGAKPERRAGDRRRVAVDCMYPTSADAVARLQRGDNVPWADCGWRSVVAGAVLDVSALDPAIVASLEKNGAFGAPAETEGGS